MMAIVTDMNEACNVATSCLANLYANGYRQADFDSLIDILTTMRAHVEAEEDSQ